MQQDHAKTLTTLVNQVQELIDLQKRFAKAKTNGEPGQARSIGTEFVILRDKVEARLPEARSILSASQTELFNG